ncbi:MAG TPA: non-homologous end-joining DNA ligase [Myxococcaceae bacterium]|nr:non-homologous end-joining DNA ligase [Myxococcaceae bacterium]
MARRSDPLETYRQKRDFSVTPEPSPERPAPTPAGALRFMVHKHDATRLHYDLRLEHHGVLVSFACPKGPSYDPAQKRLAVQTEDHPLAYGDFEGRIPDGEYGAGDSIIWDRGTYDTVPPGQFQEQLRKGHLHVVFNGQKLKGGWHLVRTRPQGGKAQWLLFKAKDGTERSGYDVVVERPESVASGRRLTRGPERQRNLRGVHPDPETLLSRVWPPMLAVLAKGTPAPADQYVYEVKYDGYRAVAAVSGGKTSVRSRNDLDFAARFPWVVPALSQIVVGEAVVDGELVALDEQGVSRFQKLGDGSAEHRYMVFDLLWLDGEDLRSRPLEERRELLESVMANTRPPLELSQRVRGDEESALAEARRRGWEGLLAKLRGSPYVGTRSSDWLKLKVLGTDELVIAGWTPISNGAAEIGALLVASRRGDQFVYAGKVGTGFDRAMRRRLLTLLKKDEVPRATIEDAPRMRDAHWVTPRHVAELQFTEWTRDGKLRHPSFQGLREDKEPGEIGKDQEQPSKTVRRSGSSSAGSGSGRRAAGRSVSPARSRTTATSAGRASKSRKGSARGAGASKSRTSRPEGGDGQHDGPTGFFGTSPAEGFGTWHSNRSEDPEAPVPRPSAEVTAAEPPPAEVPLTSPDKVLFPVSKITKREVRAYDDAVAPALIAALRERPLSMQQWPQGIGKPGIFRQGATTAPAWIPRVTVQHADHPLEHIVVDRPETVSWLANQSALTLHMTSSRAATVDNPDWVAFDFDPATGWEQIIPLARALKGLLDELKLLSVPKTSGKRGLHVFVPLGPGHTHEQALAFAEAVSGALAARFPDQATTERSLNRRRGRLYLDAHQNGRLKTMVAPYSIRAVEGAPVSTPLEWDEVDARLDPGRFNIRTLPARLRERGDLFAPALAGKQRLPEFRA